MAVNPYYLSAHWRALRSTALKRDGGMCVTPGCRLRAVIVDHIQTRPPVAHATSFDVLPNLRSLCRSCDSQIKERGGVRKRGGIAVAKGCDADGWPLARRIS
jgi:hypothetical protein